MTITSIASAKQNLRRESLASFACPTTNTTASVCGSSQGFTKMEYLFSADDGLCVYDECTTDGDTFLLAQVCIQRDSTEDAGSCTVCVYFFCDISKMSKHDSLDEYCENTFSSSASSGNSCNVSETEAVIYLPTVVWPDGQQGFELQFNGDANLQCPVSPSGSSKDQINKPAAIAGMVSLFVVGVLLGALLKSCLGWGSKKKTDSIEDSNKNLP